MKPINVETLPLLDEVHDYEDVRPAYRVQGSALIVKIVQLSTHGIPSGKEFQILDPFGHVLDGLTVQAMDHFKGREADAASARSLCQWIRDNSHGV